MSYSDASSDTPQLSSVEQVHKAASHPETTEAMPCSIDSASTKEAAPVAARSPAQAVDGDIDDASSDIAPDEHINFRLALMLRDDSNPDRRCATCNIPYPSCSCGTHDKKVSTDARQPDTASELGALSVAAPEKPRLKKVCSCADCVSKFALTGLRTYAIAPKPSDQCRGCKEPPHWCRCGFLIGKWAKPVGSWEPVYGDRGGDDEDSWRQRDSDK